MIIPTVIGTYTLPQHRLAVLLDQTKRVNDKILEGNLDTASLIKTLGFTATSQSYYRNRQELELFGLLEGKVPNIEITPLGLRAIGEDTTEKQAALEEVFDKFELWKELRERVNDSTDTQAFRQALIDITQDRSFHERTFEKFKKAYFEDLRFITQSKTEPTNDVETHVETPPVSRETNILTPEIVTSAPKKPIGSITYPEYSDSPIQIKDELSYEIAQKLLEAMGNRLGIQRKQIQMKL